MTSVGCENGGAGSVEAIAGLKGFAFSSLLSLGAHDALRNTNGFVACIQFNPGMGQKLRVGA